MIMLNSLHINNISIAEYGLINIQSTMPSPLFKIFPPEVLYFYCRYMRNHTMAQKALEAYKCSGAVDYQYRYCRDIEDLEGMWRKIAASQNTEYQYWYCLLVKDREEMWRKIAISTHPRAPFFQYSYCKNVKDREEIWRALSRHTHPYAARWQYEYYVNVSNRPEMVNALMRHKNPEAIEWQNKYKHNNLEVK